MFDWSAVITGGSVAALVTLGANLWLLRPRPDVRLIGSGPDVDDAERILRANDGQSNWINHQHWHPGGWVKMVNYGDGTAHDIKLTGDECQPYVWVGDIAQTDQISADVEARVSIRWPTWSDTLSELPPGKSVSIMVMVPTDRKRNPVGIRASWPRLPGRPFGRRHHEYRFAEGRKVEMGWPGE